MSEEGMYRGDKVDAYDPVMVACTEVMWFT